MSKAVRNGEKSLQTKKIVLNYYVISILLYGRKFSKICPGEKCQESSSFDRTMPKIPWAYWVSNMEVLKKMLTERTLILRIRKIELNFLGDILKKQISENLNFAGYIEGNKVMERQRVTYLTSLCERRARALEMGEKLLSVAQ